MELMRRRQKWWWCRWGSEGDIVSDQEAVVGASTHKVLCHVASGPVRLLALRGHFVRRSPDLPFGVQEGVIYTRSVIYQIIDRIMMHDFFHNASGSNPDITRSCAR